MQGVLQLHGKWQRSAEHQFPSMSDRAYRCCIPYRAGQWNIVPLLAVCALLVAAGAVDLSEEALIGVLVAQQSARAWRIESLQAVVVKLRHLIHPSHPRVSQHLAALVPCATSVDMRAC